MPVIGVRELRERTSKVIRRVRKEGAEAEMVQATKKAALSGWEAYERLAKEIRTAWPEDVSSQDLIAAIRR